jgi:hypothetical protein
MRMQGLSLLIAVAVLLVAASVAAADPATVNTTVNAINVSFDTTGDAIADIQADDTSGVSPGGVSTGDGWYTVDKSDIMFIDGFNTTGISGSITGVVLNMQYSVEDGYGGSNPVQWALDAGTLTTTGIAPANGEVDKVASYDLYAQGIDTVGEISTLDVEFTSNDNAGADAVSFDYVFVTVTYNNPPVAGTPQTYDSTTFASKTTFERNDDMFINVSVTDVNGASDLDTVLITISNTTGPAIVNNDTMIQDYSIEGGYVYNYSWTVPGDADMGTWTINVYANDTSDAWDSNSTTFVVQDAQAPEWSNAQTNKTYVYENDSVKFTTNWTDDVALAGYKFSINQTGTWVNSSLVSFSGTSDTSENSTQITASTGTTVEWRFYAKDTSDNENATDIQSFVVTSPAPPLSSPYMIYGWVFYENQTACNNPVVNITNLNSSTLWQAETNASYNYYQITLANGTDLNASEILQFNVKAPDGSQVNTTFHTITQTEINDGGLFDFNITLEPPVTPFVIYGWVNYTNGNACNNPAVDITNTNTGMQWQAETHNGNNYYQLVLDTTNISTGDVLQFNVTDGTESNSTNHTVTASDINSGGIFDFNLTLTSGSQTDGPTVDSITITPDDDDSTSGVQVYPNPGGAKTVTVTVVVSDPNGCGDISTVNITNIDPDPAHGDPSPVTLVNQSGSGTTATYNGTFDMQFYDLPDEYTVTVTAKDTNGSSGTNSSKFNYTSCTAMSLDSGTIAFGSIDPGENNTVAGDKDMNTTSSPTVRNTGNVVIDVNITGSNMTSGSDTITKDQMDALVGALSYSDLGVARCFNVNLAAGNSSLENVDFRLNVPYGIPAGSYTGSVTLTADTCG